jgi:cytochrome c oxidase assembly factor CtaG
LFALEPALEETLMTFTRGYSSLDDQTFAGVIMWVPGSFPLLIPILRLIVEPSTSRVEIVRTHG